MELTSVKVIKNLLGEYKATPLKGLGQNFLVDKLVLKKIIESADLQPNDVVLEIGPGIGTLTQELAKRAKKVIAIEKDRKMCKILRELLGGLPRTEPKVLVRDWKVGNVEIIEGDILKIKNLKLKIKNYKVVANLPYYIVAPVIRKFLELAEVRPPQMILMVQKEVAKRICSKPPNMNLLAVSVQFYAKPEILFYVPRNSFWPQPKVDGAIIKISKIKNQKSKIDTNLFFKIVKAGFSQPRKQIVNNLTKMLELEKPRSRTSSLRDKEEVKNWLLENGVEPSQRAETLSIEDWIRLTKNSKWKT